MRRVRVEESVKRSATDDEECMSSRKYARREKIVGGTRVRGVGDAARTFLNASVYSPYSRPNILARVRVDLVDSRHIGGLRAFGLCGRSIKQR
jgi:hypothetical protein